MNTILVDSDVKGSHQFCEILKSQIDYFHITSSIKDIVLEDVEIVIIWLKVPDYLSTLSNLKLILICGSGVDHIIESPNLPHNIPTVRLVDFYLRDRVTNYVIKYINNHFFPDIEYQQDHGLIKFFESTPKPKIGIMGLGLIGGYMSEKLSKLGFKVCGWVRTVRPRTIDEVYIGQNELIDFVRNCEVLVCQLPLTKETKGILNRELFKFLPHNAYLINVGRGKHLVEIDLIDAIDNGILSGACLDVFEVEPLPKNHPFQTHPKIITTPHIAGYVSPETQSPYAAEIINLYSQNKKVMGKVNYSNLY